MHFTTAFLAAALAALAASQVTSPDNTCGGTNAYVCPTGSCCSSSGYCGTTEPYCGAGCQKSFGTCSATASSPDGSCGGTNAYLCTGSALQSFGGCCSGSGYCGNATAFCGNGCQSSFSTTGMCLTPTTDSPNGSCGGTAGYTCTGDAATNFGGCCSSSGYCGTSVLHCGTGCQTALSAANACTVSTGPPSSSNGACGSVVGTTCAGGLFNGQCCSQYGFCGTTTGHCGTGCQVGYGACT